MKTVNIDKEPSKLMQYYKAVNPGSKPKKVDALPEIKVTRKGIKADAKLLASYNKVCGFSSGDNLPSTFPHIMSHALFMELLTQKEFPFQLLGLVHINNTITQYRPISKRAKLDIECNLGQLKDHDKGKVVPIITKVYENGELVWEEVAENLRRLPTEGGSKKKKASEDILTGQQEQWKLPFSLGFQYAKVSGDFNPIHLMPLSAKLFGFKQHIIHGMWTKAKTLAFLENKIGDSAFKIRVDFKLPLYLPGKVHLTHTTDGNNIPFEVRSSKDLKPHLKGLLEIL